MLHPQAWVSHQVRAFLPPLHCWGPHSQCQQVHVVVWQFSTILLPIMPHLFLSRFPCNSYPPSYHFLFVLGHAAHACDIIAGIPQWCMLFMVCFILPLVVPPAPSPQYICAVYFVGCIIQPKISVYYAHTHLAQKVWVWLLVAFCTWLAHLFKFCSHFSICLAFYLVEVPSPLIWCWLLRFFIWPAPLSIAMPPLITSKCFDCSAPIPQSAGASVVLCATTSTFVHHHCQLLHRHGMSLLTSSLILLLYHHSHFTHASLVSCTASFGWCHCCLLMGPRGAPTTCNQHGTSRSYSFGQIWADCKQIFELIPMRFLRVLAFWAGSHRACVIYPM